MITVGVDLAAEPKKTAVARIEWDDGKAVVVALSRGNSDGDILQASEGAEKVGIDAPFGWPELFIDFLSAHREHRLEPPHQVDLNFRRTLANRATDFYVKEICGVQPLSVASDRIASVAMRCAGIQAQFAAKHGPVSRSGTGLLVEVYPAAALQRWGLTSRGYKGAVGGESLQALFVRLQACAPWLDMGAYAGQISSNDDEFDAVISALIARAAWHQNLVESVPAEAMAAAEAEGWIALTKQDSLLHLAED